MTRARKVVLSRVWGLRPRLVATCVLIAAMSASAASGISYVTARNTIIEDATNSIVQSLLTRSHSLFCCAQLPPTQRELDDRGVSLGYNSMVVYHDMRSRTGPDLAMFTADLREAVRTGNRVLWKRILVDGSPVLIIGIPVQAWRTDGTLGPSGLEIYSERSLRSQDTAVQSLAAGAWGFGALAAVFAVLVALFAARGVLRPVRELSAAARRLGAGDLRARLRIRGNDELADLASTFNDTAGAVERYVGQLRRMESDAHRFVADVSHELRTPLAAMTAVAEVLEEEAPHLAGDAGQAANLVSQETRKLARLVEDLMEISRFDAGAARLALDDVDVATAVAATVQARGWAGQVSADLPAGVLARVDPRRLDVIVANLVGNALKHGAPPVRLELSVDSDWLELRVLDNGSGLDPEVLPQVFDRFYKADSSRARSEGSGLGLAIAWENARLHTVGELQGSLEVGNRPEGGAVFMLRLPRGLDQKGPR